LIVSICTYLFRLASLSAVPLVGRPSASLSWSASSTPVSPPVITATGSCLATASAVSVSEPWCTMLSVNSSVAKPR
jgi:hypothetical protein